MDFALALDIHAHGRPIQDQDFRLCRQPFANNDALLVAAGKGARQHIRGKRVDVQLLDAVDGFFRHLFEINQPVFLLFLVDGGGGEVVLQAALHKQAFGKPVFGHIGDFRFFGVRYVPEVLFLPPDQDFAAGGFADAEQRLGKLGSPAAQLPGDAEDFPGENAEADILKGAFLAELFHLQQRRLRSARIAEGFFRDAFAGHVINQIFFFKFIRVFIGDDFAIADDRNPVAYRKHLVQLMAHENDRNAPCGKPPDDFIQALNFLVCKGGCGFIHDDEPGILQNCAGNGDNLLLRYG